MAPRAAPWAQEALWVPEALWGPEVPWEREGQPVETERKWVLAEALGRPEVSTEELVPDLRLGGAHRIMEGDLDPLLAGRPAHIITKGDWIC